MSYDPEAIVERRRLRRRLSFWRVVAVFAAFVALGVVAIYNGASTSLVSGGAHIARVKVEGLITDDHDQLELLSKIENSDSVVAVVLHVNSPGGTTTGGEALFEAIRKVSGRKPVVAVFGTIATSAAYIVGLATDRIVSRGNTITGSVGVIFQWAEVHELLAKLGVTMREVKSGVLKASPSMFQPLDDQSRALAQSMVDESQIWFLDLVRTRRGIDPHSVPGLSEGRIFSGRQALDLKLVDSIGSEEQAITWLETDKGIAKGLKIVDWEESETSQLNFLSGLAKAGGLILDGLGLGYLRRAIDAAGISGQRLDGLLSIWQIREK